MNISSFILALIAVIFPITDSRADNCQFFFQCQGSICERVLPATCAVNIPAAKIVVNQTPYSISAVNPPATSSTFANSTSIPPEQISGSSSPAPTPPPTIGPSCAENGSCYGDISNINGMPKTNHVNGYFRSNGTYVRGHYRSGGR